tara:strand:- start:2301 stop:2492 length:192 start_codon:yes stop_codon:yes gene_type:complete
MEKQVRGVDFKVGDMVINPVAEATAVVLGFEENKLFDSVYCVKVMYVGDSKPMYVLSDRIRKL